MLESCRGWTGLKITTTTGITFREVFLAKNVALSALTSTGSINHVIKQEGLSASDPSEVNEV